MLIDNLLETADNILTIRRSQKKTLSNIAAGLIKGKNLRLAEIGRNMETSAKEKNNIKTVDRFLGNNGVNRRQAAVDIFLFLTASYKEIYMSVDWTDCNDGVHQALQSALVINSRAIPIWSKTIRKEDLQSNQNRMEEEFMAEIKEMFLSHKDITILADRGFHRISFLRLLDKLGFKYIVRLPMNIRFTHLHFNGKLGEIKIVRGNFRDFKKGLLSRTEKYPIRLIVSFDKGHDEPWLLATNMEVSGPQKIIKGYGRRFEIEESFRDAKSPQYGFGLRGINISKSERWDRMFLIISFSYMLMVLAGLWGETKGIHRRLMANTVKRRALALWRVGRYVLLKMEKLRVTFEKIFMVIPTLLYTG